MSTLSSVLLQPASADVQTTDSDGDCIWCPCRPHVGLCGSYIDSPVVEEMDGSECRLCVEATKAACPNCGCGQIAKCQPCKESIR